MKSSLSSQLSDEITKPIYNNATFIEARNNIETLVSMVEMAYDLPYKHEDSTITINLVMLNWSRTFLNHCLPEIRTDLR